jgi:Uncharacterized protein conserved in bacteria
MDRDTTDFSLAPMLFEDACPGGDDSSGSAAPTAQQVVDFLGKNPDFFIQYGELLHQMTPPPRWSDGPIVDFQARRLAVLKEEMAGLRDCAVSVIETSRVNLATQARTHAAVLKLLEAASLDDLLRVVSDELPDLLAIDIARLAIEAEGEEAEAMPDDVAVLPKGAVASLLDGEDALLLPLIIDDGTLFGGAADEIESAALVRLPRDDDEAPGLLVFGAKTGETFQPRQGTELVRFLAQVVARCLVSRPLLPA